jgi:glucosylceramidase
MNFSTRASNRQNIRLFVRTGLLWVPLLFFAACKPIADKAEIPAEKNGVEKLNLVSSKQYVTAQNTGYRLTELEILDFTAHVQPDEHTPTIMLDAGKTFQTIEGFGGALTDAAAETFFKLPVAKQEELLEAYFDPDKGIGYSLCRTHINSCDFSAESYAYSEVEGDTELKHFSIQRDLKFRIPFTRAAIEKSGGQLRFVASPWSPPAWMKTNNHMLQGGKLKPEYRQTWADFFVKFIDAYQNEGIPIWGLTVQNEPMAVQKWESCLYTAEEERDFVKNNLGPTLERTGKSGVKIIVWDHNRGIMYQRAKVVYDDPEAAKYVWGTGFHWYTGDHFDNVKLHREAFPDKKTLFTEGCVFPFDYSKIHEWQWGEQYGKSIINDLNNSASGWIDWNVLVDETGGPNHVANFCYAPVIGNTKTGELIYMNSFYYLGHFSKFIRPGAKRIICSSNFDDLHATAMVNPDGSIVLVVMNRTGTPIEFYTWIENRGFKAGSLPHSISTYTFD